MVNKEKTEDNPFKWLTCEDSLVQMVQAMEQWLVSDTKIKLSEDEKKARKRAFPFCLKKNSTTGVYLAQEYKPEEAQASEGTLMVNQSKPEPEITENNHRSLFLAYLQHGWPTLALLVKRYPAVSAVARNVEQHLRNTEPFLWLTDIKALDQVVRELMLWGEHTTEEAISAKEKEARKMLFPFRVTATGKCEHKYDPAKVRWGTHAPRMVHHDGQAGAYTAGPWSGPGVASDPNDSFYFAVDKDGGHKDLCSAYQKKGWPTLPLLIQRYPHLSEVAQDLARRLQETEQNWDATAISAGVRQLVVQGPQGLLAISPIPAFILQNAVSLTRDRMDKGLSTLLPKGVSAWRFLPQIAGCDLRVNNIQNSGVAGKKKARMYAIPPSYKAQSKAGYVMSAKAKQALQEQMVPWLVAWKKTNEELFNSQRIRCKLYRIVTGVLRESTNANVLNEFKASDVAEAVMGQVLRHKVILTPQEADYVTTAIMEVHDALYVH